LGKIKYFENHITFSHLIKGTVIGRRCGGANTFPVRNQLSGPKSGFLADLILSFCFFFKFSKINNGGDSKLYMFSNLIFGSSSRRDFGCDTREGC